ncbi:hypothetical protein CA13_67340 [Planctomycetes bacterium CA13]|uniref:Flippase-like domain-containing protein n=1 Tax=Novipirellula herctigrandis TaxID=2527986 RepID=A0A5C5YMU0_9BACT|nr:hypothetical protein CA13_67340 [Planctomycetes bacterium CA13]
MKDQEQANGSKEAVVVNEPPSSKGRLGKTFVKAVIAVVVVIGLSLATRSAIQSWQDETAKISAEILRLDLQIQDAKEPSKLPGMIAKRESLRGSVPRLSNIQWTRIAIAGLLYGLGLLPSAMVLGGWLEVLGFVPNKSLVIAAQTLGHVGKYVPGKAMVVVVRAGVLSRAEVPAVPATISVFLETFMMMAVGAAVAGVIICFLPVPPWMMVAAILGAIGASLPTLPPVLRQVTTRLLGRDSRLSDNAWRACGVGWLWSILSWLLIGSSFAMIIASIPSSSLGVFSAVSGTMLWAVATAAISLAMVIGFASLIPGGAGVRELVLATILGFAIGPTQALLSAIMARLVFIVVECLMAAVAWWYVNRRFVADRSAVYA